MRNDADVVDDVLALDGLPAVAEIDAEDHLRSPLTFRAEAEGASGQQRRYRRDAQMTDPRFHDVVACIDRYTLYRFARITLFTIPVQRTGRKSATALLLYNLPNSNRAEDTEFTASTIML